MIQQIPIDAYTMYCQSDQLPSVFMNRHTRHGLKCVPPLATDVESIHPPITYMSFFAPLISTVWMCKFDAVLQYPKIRVALPDSAAGIPAALAVITPFCTFVEMPFDATQLSANVCNPLARVQLKSPFTSRFTRFAMFPLSSCGQPNHAVLLPDWLTSSTVTVSPANTFADTHTRSQPDAALSVFGAFVTLVTARLLFPFIRTNS